MLIGPDHASASLLAVICHSSEPKHTYLKAINWHFIKQHRFNSQTFDGVK